MFKIGTVVASYPEGNSVDVLLDGDGSRLSNVQVGVRTGSSITGEIDLPDVGGPTGDDRWSPTAQRALYIKAVIGFADGVPFVNCFLLPQINQITFKEKNRRITRHASDAYTSVDDAGNIELYHPSGTYVRLATTAAHEDLTGKDFDKKWAIARNTDKAVHVQLTVKNAGVQKASLNIDPSGNVTLNHVGNLSSTTGGNATVAVTGNAAATIGGTADVTSGGNMKLTAPQITLQTPNAIVTGKLTVQGGMAVSGGSGATAAFTGSVTVTGGEVTVDGIGVKSHHHQEHDGPNTSAAIA